MAAISLTVATTPNLLTLTGVKTLGAPADIIATATNSSGATVPLGTLPAQPDGPYSLTATVTPDSYTVQVSTSATLSSDATASFTVPPATLTADGNNTLGYPATVVVTATPAAGGSPITVGTLTGQPGGPFSLTANAPPGAYNVDTSLTATVSGDCTSDMTVAPGTLTVTGCNDFAVPADVVVTATPSYGGDPITVGTLLSQPPGPFSVAAAVPAGAYTIDTAMNVSLAACTQSTATVPPTTLTANGNNTLGVPADVVVTATPAAGGCGLVVGTLNDQPAGAFTVTGDVPPGDYTVQFELTGTVSSDVQSTSTVAPTVLSASGSNSLSVPATIVVTATPVDGGSPITVATLSNQPVGAYSVSANVPDGTYSVDMAASALLAASATATATVPSPDLAAMITYNGNNYSFTRSAGTDLGDYVDPQGRFVHGCVMATNPGLPSFKVFFRSDKQAGATRDEVVFELGDLFTTPTPFNMTAYTATIVKAGVTLATLSVPQHFWHSRWRWQSAARPVTTSVASLIASGMLPHYDASISKGYTPPTSTFSYSIMGLAGIYPNMCITGERADIGPVTDWQADYICNGSASALSTLLAQLEGSGTLPWHFRDENTNSPLDVFAYPNASLYSTQVGKPYIQQSTNTGIKLDPAHEPALAFVPFLLTGDSYALEELQYAITYNIISLPPSARQYYDLTDATRAHAWSLRSLAQAAAVTPANVPNWLKSQSYFQKILNGNRDWMLASYVNNAASIPATVFSSLDMSYGSQNVGNILANTYSDAWMQDFEAFILGWVVQMGNADWAPIHQWKLQSTIARSNGTSGWVRAHTTPYNVALRATPTSAWVQCWADAWALNVSLQPSNLVVADPNCLYVTKAGDITYPSYTRGALAMANRLGVAAAQPCFSWLDGQIGQNLSRTIYINFKWCIS